jgi:hypothetical protein
MITDLLATKLHWAFIIGLIAFVKIFLGMSWMGVADRFPEVYSWIEKRVILKDSLKIAALCASIIFIITFVVVPGEKILVKDLGNNIWEDESGNLVVTTPSTNDPDYTFRRDKPEGWYRSWLGNWRYSISNPYDERVMIGKKLKKIKMLDTQTS